MTHIMRDYAKVQKVINSCKNLDHVNCAFNLLLNFRKLYAIGWTDATFNSVWNCCIRQENHFTEKPKADK